MKPRKLLWRSVRFFVVCVLTLTLGIEQNLAGTGAPKEAIHYVVIGAFKIEKNAERFVEFAVSSELPAQYEFNPSRRLFYVYVYSSKDRSDATRELYRVRKKYQQYQDAWLFEGELGGTQDTPAAGLSEPIPKKESTIVKNVEEIQEEEEEEVDYPLPDSTALVIAPPEEKPNTYLYYFNTFNVQTGREIDGKINLIDPVRAQKLKEVNTHEIVKVPDPNNGSNTMKFATNIFGYKEVQHVIPLDNPKTDSTEAYVETMGDSIIVDFQLERFKKGDVLVMYNVYFFRDAAIMRSESLYELKSLFSMLSENENYKVTIHGHTNGNAVGKIIHLNEDDKKFFTLNANHKEDVGSAKRLSFHRANTIKQWLIDQGIAEDRIKTKGWGGKKMIYDKHSSQAVKNVRVEIEITAD